MSFEIIEKLKQIRENPRKMQEKYLKSSGVFDYIVDNTHDYVSWKIKDRIDFIIGGCEKRLCHCGNQLKTWQSHCSQKCAGSDPEFVKRISKLQKDNAVDRYNKTKKTMLEKYGVTHNNQLQRCIDSRKQKRELYHKELRVETFKKYGLDISKFQTTKELQEMVDNCCSLTELSSNFFGGMPKTTIVRHMSEYGVKLINDVSTSAGEKDLANFVKSLGFEISQNNRDIIKPYELDIVVESKKIAIEYNGIYWHSEECGTDPNSMKMKLELANKAGYQVINVLESEWILQREKVESIISSKLGIVKNRIYARNCSVKFIDSKTGKQFFEKTHIQNNAVAKYYIGLYNGENLVAACSFGKSRFDKMCDYELIRFSSEFNTQIVGGFSKILKFFKTNVPGSISTYCDLRYSNGSMYSQFGELIKKTSPNYSWYTVLGDGEALSRYKTQKKKLKTLFPDKYRNDLSENEIMESAGYFKVFDCGNLLYNLNRI